MAPTSTTAKASAFRLAVCGQTGAVAIEILKAIAGNAIEAALAAAERIRQDQQQRQQVSLSGVGTSPLRPSWLRAEMKLSIHNVFFPKNVFSIR